VFDSTQQRLGVVLGNSSAENPILHLAHGADVLFFGNLAKADPGRELDIHGQRAGFADHDRFSLIRFKSIAYQCVMESNSPTIAGWVVEGLAAFRQDPAMVRVEWRLCGGHPSPGNFSGPVHPSPASGQ
jgi:hypothetical protein